MSPIVTASYATLQSTPLCKHNAGDNGTMPGQPLKSNQIYFEMALSRCFSSIETALCYSYVCMLNCLHLL